MKKKIVTIISLCTASALILAGCASASAAEAEEEAIETTEAEEEAVEETEDAAGSEAEADEAEAEAAEEPVITESGEITYDYEDWAVENFEDLSEVITGIEDYEYVVGEGCKNFIHHGVTYDPEVVSAVLFDTSGVDFDTPGTYDITYRVYFHRVGLAGWLDLYDMDLGDYPGVDANTDRIRVTVPATVTITGAEAKADDATEAVKTEDTQVVAAETTETAVASADNGSSYDSSWDSGSYDSGSSGSSQPSHNHSYTGTVTKAATCGASGTMTYTCSCGASYTESIPATGNHNWVATQHDETGHYETQQVCVQEGYEEEIVVDDGYVCKSCGYRSSINVFGSSNAACGDITLHCLNDNYACYSSYADYDYVYHDPVYEETTVWVTDSPAYTTYTCSVCGATK